jgi:hypothetical protein
MTRTTRFAVALVAAAGGMLATRAARAQTDAGVTLCSSLPNPIYMGGSSAFQPTVNLYAAKLAAETPATTLIYNSSASCTGATQIANNSAVTGTATYFTAAGVSSTCTLDTNTHLDVGVSDVFYDSCASSNQAPSPKPATVQDAVGPAQAMEIIVPQNNTTGYLTALEGNDIWGCGKYTSPDGKVVFNMNGIFVRGTSSGSQIITAAAIGLNDNAFIGNNMTTSPMIMQVSGGSAGMAKAVGTYPTQNQGSLNAIGFLGADVFDSTHSATPGAAFIALPFAASGQTKAYYVDSEPGSRDRQNVRDGHYFAWGYEHMLYNVAADGGTQPSAAAAKIINLVTGAATDKSFDYVQLDAVAGTIPLCAMSVAKANDSPGYLSVSPPSTSCNCAYVAAASGNVPSGCTACTAGDGGSTCGSGKSCQHGYCE